MNLTNSDLYNSIIEKHKPILDEIEEAVIIHRVRDIEIQSKEKAKKIDNIIEYWCNYYEVDREDAEGGSRIHKLKTLRYCVFWSIRNQVIANNLTLEGIAAIFNRHHSTAVHGLKQMDDWIQYDSTLRGDIMLMLNHFGYRAEWHFQLEELSWIKKDALYLELNQE